MSRRVYLHCSTCNQIVLVHGEPQKGDRLCPHRSRPRTPIEPTVYYENSTGQRLYPWDSRALPKEYTNLGYERREVSGIQNIRNFERATRRQLEDEQQRKHDEQQREYAEQRDRNHSDLRGEMSGMDDWHRELARESMAEESRGYEERYESAFRIGAYE